MHPSSILVKNMHCEDYEKIQNQNVLLGPWGGKDGARWDDGVYSSVRQVVISHGAAIDSIQIEYDERGCSIWSDKHGGTGGCRVDKIKLDFPQEYLKSISGSYGCLTQWGPVIVRSLSLESNRKKYGPFGIQEGTKFSFPVTCGKIIGFHGRCSWYLDSIGVYLKPLLQHQINQPKALCPSSNILHCSSSSPNFVGYTVTQEIEETYDVVLVKDELRKDLPKSYPPQVLVVPYYNQKESPNVKRSVLRCGPWGGDGGMTFDDGIYTGVREVHVAHNCGIVYIKACYDKNGQAFWGNKNGGKAGFKLDKVEFDYPSEILTHISGYYGSAIFKGPTVVRSLTFHTTKRKYGPFGDEQGTSFSSGSKLGKIVGFHGSEGWFVDSIGVHVLEENFMIPRPPTTDNFFSVNYSNNEIGYKMVKGSTPAVLSPSIGEGNRPWGGEGGHPWDDGAFSGVRQIHLVKGNGICSIQFEYDMNGQSIWSPRHGGGGGYSTHKIKFEYPHEVLTRVSGYYGPNPVDGFTKVIRSLTFCTNRAKYGSFGEEIGTFFSSTTEGKVIGFHGRSGSYLNAIGVHMEHSLGDQGRVKTVLHKIFN